jgi:hypothetical protein
MISHSSLRRHWNPLNNPEMGFMDSFSKSIENCEKRYPDLLPDLRNGSMIFIGSDYSGQHKTSLYESLSFLFADLSGCDVWEGLRGIFRQRYLSDGRRISFKDLGDKKRKLALSAFLSAANTIPGLIVTILIDKNIASLFRTTGRLTMDTPELSEYSHWGSATFEKLLRVVHFVSLFLTGLSRPYQDILWITDEDDIVANEERLREFVKIFSIICSHYLKHDLRHLRIGSTKSDTGKRDIEDLVSLADIVSGALVYLLTQYKKNNIIPGEYISLPPLRNLNQKTTEIMNWFADHTNPLKRLVYEIKEDVISKKLILRYWRFHGSRDLYQSPCLNLITPF